MGNAQKNKSNEIINVSIAKERKYKISYETLSTNEQKKVRGKIRRKLFSFSDRLVLLQKNPKSTKKDLVDLKKEFKSFADATYLNVDYSNRNLFYNGSNANKISEIDNLLAEIKKK